MTHERSYSLRWLHAAGPALALLVHYTWHLGPLLTIATESTLFFFLSEWVYGIAVFWTGDGEFARDVTPDLWFPLLGAAEVESWTAWIILVLYGALSVLAGFAFLRTLSSRETLPAKRRLSLPAIVALSAAWACLALCLVFPILRFFQISAAALGPGSARSCPKCTRW